MREVILDNPVQPEIRVQTRNDFISMILSQKKSYAPYQETSIVMSLSQLEKLVAAQQSVHPTASGIGMLARFGHWLVRLGWCLIQNGGG